jgi:hypothetical protein
MEIININNEETAQYIWSKALQCSCKPFSWGLDFDSIKTIEGGTTFRVKGASVKIQLEKMGLFTVIIIPDDKQKSRIVCERLILGRLVPTIDEAVKYGQISSMPQYQNISSVAERVAV